MAKKNQEPDQSNNPYDAELEQHVDELLATDEQKKATGNGKIKKIAILHHGEEVTADPSPVEPDSVAEEVVEEALPLPEAPAVEPEVAVASAPILPDAPVPKEPFKITVFHDEEETADAPAEAAEAEPLNVPGLPVEVTEDTTPETVPEPELSASVVPEPPKSAIREISFDDGPEVTLDEKYNDEKTNALVDDIVAKDGDALLAAEDAMAAEQESPVKAQKNLPKQVHEASPWQWALVRWSLFWLLLVGIAAAVIVPTSRYYMLNKAGVQSSASITITDRSTLQPLKNATVKIANQTVQTNDKGVAQFQHLHLGPTTLTIEKRAFAKVSQSITIGWGSNPLASHDLAPTGVQYTFTVTDYVTGKPVTTAAATSEYADANADKDGMIKLTFDNTDNHNNVTVTVKADGYRDEQLPLGEDSKAKIAVKLVNSHKHTYVSKASGTYDVHTTDIDGKNDKIILAGTGSEGSDTVLAPSGGNLVALVSTRDNAKDKDGNLLSTLTVIDVNTGTTAKVSQSAQIHVIGWSQGKLAYVQVASGADQNNPDRQRLMSYDFAKRDNKQLTSANTFNDVTAVGDELYYAPAAGNSDPTGSLTRIKFDGSSKQVILSAEVWNTFRTDFDHLTISVPGTWWQHTIGTKTVEKLDAQPQDITSRGYVDSPDGKHSLWIDRQAGKSALKSYDTATKKDTVLTTADGVQYPVAWLDNATVVYRIATQDETADYVISLNGGEAHKITDVALTGSKDSWYYY